MGEPLTSLEPLEPAVACRPLALLCDVDGTISPLAPTPWQARVTPRNRTLLESLSHCILVALVSGRDLPDLQRLIALPDLIYIGLHGLAWRIAGTNELAPEAEPYREFTEQAVADLGYLKRIDGLVVERKSVGVAFHYRGVAKAATVRGEILRALASSAAASCFEVHDAIRVVELRPPIGITKGVALRRLADRFGLRGMLYLGDDVTDVDAFEELKRQREAGSIAGFGVAVTHSEAPAAAAAAADFTLPNVDRVEWLLGELAGRLGAERPARQPESGGPDHSKS